MPEVCAGEPTQFQPVEIDDFVALVQAGGEVEPERLRNRVMTRGVSLGFLRESTGCLLGVGGLKAPFVSHRKQVATDSATALAEGDFPYELGWVFVLPSARGRKLSFPLCEPLVTQAAGKGIFATSRIGNIGMHATLKKLGFVRTGKAWRSKQNQEELVLFLKKAV
ncbi:MAG: N-acetyltransferase [Gammaproteobacteria bacterium]|nr:N-acetyltransferase [Gammaproteobacteria bacterium]